MALTHTDQRLYTIIINGFLLHNATNCCIQNLTCVKLQTVMFEVLASVPLTHTNLPTMQLASVSCETHSLGISPTLHNILYGNNLISW